MVMTETANDLADDPHHTFVTRRVNHVSLALMALNGHHLSNQVAHPLWTIDVSEAAPSAPFPELADNTCRISRDKQHVSEMDLVHPTSPCYTDRRRRQ